MMLSDRTLALITAALLMLLLGWDLSGLDLPLAQLFGDSNGFAWRESWWLTKVLHEGARTVSWLLLLALLAGIWWPWGGLARLPRGRRVQLVAGALAAALLVSLLKGASATSCPWDLAEFGGPARHLTHWLGFLRSDGGPGHCFPAGHASSGFVFLAGYFAFRADAPVLARRWLIGAVVAGLLLGWAQQVRGAHFMSHTLWTGLLCWMVVWAVDGLWRRFGAHERGAVLQSVDIGDIA